MNTDKLKKSGIRKIKSIEGYEQLKKCQKNIISVFDKDFEKQSEILKKYKDDEIMKSGLKNFCNSYQSKVVNLCNSYNEIYFLIELICTLNINVYYIPNYLRKLFLIIKKDGTNSIPKLLNKNVIEKDFDTKTLISELKLIINSSPIATDDLYKYINKKNNGKNI